ncbi:hypothetical protein E3P96_04126 [Wallemia ichthyophaga]|nr:hypothetical protein E3P96_04126 [Wallemia ichthyophaga]
MAQVIHQTSPSLFRAAKWAYGSPSSLITANENRQVTLRSAQGVRQGDPLAPVFFSLALKPVLDALQNSIGDKDLVLSYLDDVYVLSNTDIQQDVFSSLDSLNLSIKLNKDKCLSKSVDDIRTEGMELLGTVVGPRHVRVGFLRRQLEVVKRKLSRLRLVRTQYAWLLLSKSFQASLRHLQRSLDLSDAGDEWHRVDDVFRSAIRELRGSPRVLPTDEDLFHLPSYQGGLGIVSHARVAPFARKAMAEQAGRQLQLILHPSSDLNQPPITQQRTYTDVANAVRYKELSDGLDLYGKLQLAENGTKLGRKPLTSLPFEPGLRFTNSEFKALLHLRTLCPGEAHICRCGQHNTPGHDDICRDRVQIKTWRHDKVRDHLASYLKAAGVSVSTEKKLAPEDPHNLMRMDLVLSHANGVGAYAMHDITIHSASALAPYIASITKDWQQKDGMQLLRAGLSHQAAKKVDKYRHVVSLDFVPLVFSAGGALSAHTMDLFKAWRSIVPSWDHLQRLIAFALVRKRVTNFRLVN